MSNILWILLFHPHLFHLPPKHIKNGKPRKTQSSQYYTAKTRRTGKECKRCSTLGTTSQSGRQNGREVARKLHSKQKVEKMKYAYYRARHAAANTSFRKYIGVHLFSSLIIPSQTEKVKKNIHHTNILQKKWKDFMCKKRESDGRRGLLIDEAGCRTSSAGNPTGWCFQSSSHVLRRERYKNSKSNKIRVDQNILLPKPGILALRSHSIESCRRKAGGPYY